MALSQTNSSRMICAHMELQPVILESQTAMNAVDGVTIERRIRISRPDEGRGRCKGSRACASPRNRARFQNTSRTDSGALRKAARSRSENDRH
jgi:hypothetical protein